MGKYFGEHNEGDLRVWRWCMSGYMSQPNKAHKPNTRYFPVVNAFAAAKLIEEKAASDLASKWISANAFGLEVYTGGEWVEWSSPFGESIEEFAASLGM